MSDNLLAQRTPLPPLPPAPSHTLPLAHLAAARRSLPPADFRRRLRATLLDRPDWTLAQVARALGVTRQRAGALAGRLDRPSCAQPSGPARPAPKKALALARMAELSARVQAGESAESAAARLGVSLQMAAKLGFRAREVRLPSHGRGRRGCACWRCRSASGEIRRRGRRGDQTKLAACLDWLAYRDPDSDSPLSRVEVARLAGVGVGAVGRVARAVEAGR
jgi:hypothetical protein